MHSYEAVSLAYFVLLGIVAFVGPFRQRARGVLLSALAATVVIASVKFASPLTRGVMPIAYLGAAYWLPSFLRGNDRTPAFETWLTQTDDRLRGWSPAMPSWLRPVAEIAYLACYPLVPCACAVALWIGREEDIARFWLPVLLSGFACYATLPWLRALPPRAAVSGAGAMGKLGRVNAFVLSRVSHGLTTFPSGHVAVSVAIAAALDPISRTAAIIAGIVAAGVALGAAAGRYHYVIDVLLGIVAAGLAVSVSTFVE